VNIEASQLQATLQRLVNYTTRAWPDIEILEDHIEII